MQRSSPSVVATGIATISIIVLVAIWKLVLAVIGLMAYWSE